MQVENFWRHIHLARQKDSTILDWGVWTVVLPSEMNAEYQYVVATVYPSFNAYLLRESGCAQNISRPIRRLSQSHVY